MVLAFLVLALVARRSSVSLSPPAQRLLEHIEKHPGLGVAELVESFGMGSGGLYRNLEALEKAGLVTRRAVGRKRLVYATTGDVPRRIPVPFSPSKRAIAQWILDHPGGVLQDVVEGAGVAQRTAHLAVRQLVNDGMVTSRFMFRFVDLCATPKLKRRLAREEAD